MGQAFLSLYAIEDYLLITTIGFFSDKQDTSDVSDQQHTKNYGPKEEIYASVK